jgi:predicted outer membrane repeat protein
MNCRFQGNYTISGDGGGLFSYDGSEPFVSGCTFSGNFAVQGGAICTEYMSNATIVDCLFYNNRATSGGALCSQSSGPYVSKCVFTGNRAWFGDGGAVYFQYGNSATIVNCTLYGNHAEHEGGSISNSTNQRPSANRIMNCILWGNSPDEIVSSTPDIHVSYCDIAGGWPGEGNVDANPLFVNAGRWAHAEDLAHDTEPNDPNAVWVDGDYHLKSQAGRWDPQERHWICDNVTSPCIDAGDPNTDWTGELWPHGGRVNMGAYGGTP